MKRYDITQLADFVRGIATPEVEQEIHERHDASSRRALELLACVADVGRRDHLHEVPHSAVRIAKAAGSLRPPEGAAVSGLRRLPFKILFDSLAQPVAAGVRSSGSDARHVVADAGDYTVDARLENETGSVTGTGHRAFVAAQILRREGGEPVPDTPVLVFSGDEVVGSGHTNQAGDFQATDLPAGPLSLCLLVPQEACIELPLSLS